MTIAHRFLLALALIVASSFVQPCAAELALGPSIVGIDHIPTSVRNLDQAAETYQKLGFSLKPGRLHPDGITNKHVKFPDGSGIELTSPPAAPADDLTAHYIDFQRQGGDGPAFLGLHVRDVQKLRQALKASGLRTKTDGDGLLVLDEPALDFLFFVGDNRSPTDRPEHFAHPNSAIAMTGVWLAIDDAGRAPLRKLLLAFGARVSKSRVLAPDSVEADVFSVQNGRVVVMGKSRQLHEGRPIAGVEFQVRDLARTMCGRGAAHRCLVPPAQAHGMWVEFHE